MEPQVARVVNEKYDRGVYGAVSVPAGVVGGWICRCLCGASAGLVGVHRHPHLLRQAMILKWSVPYCTDSAEALVAPFDLPTWLQFTTRGPPFSSHRQEWPEGRAHTTVPS